MMRSLMAGTFAWLTCLALLLLGWFSRSPFLYRFRPAPFIITVAGALLFTAVAWKWRKPAWLAWAVLSVIAALIAVREELDFLLHRHHVLNAPAHALALLGGHVVVGFQDPDQVEPLVQTGAIGGVFITKRNVQGRDADALRITLQRWKVEMRKQHGRPLLVMADQEGGVVSRLSPPLPLLPSLGELVDMAADDTQLEWLVTSFAQAQAAGLAALGVNVNLAPVVDVPDGSTSLLFDPYSRIATRSISSNVQTVAHVAGLYTRVLQDHGVLATAKHFPGLGLADQDTHLRTTNIDAGWDALMSRDWVPFQQLASQDVGLIMVAHVLVGTLDPLHLASLSPILIQRHLREELGFRGLVITDDLCMAPIAHGVGLDGAGAKAINAGVDLLLVSYDHDQYYRMMHGLLEAHADGLLRPDTLLQSHQRLAMRYTSLH